MIDWTKVGWAGWSYLETRIREYCENLPEKIQSSIVNILAIENVKDRTIFFTIRLSPDFGDEFECPFLKGEKVTKVIFTKNETRVVCTTRCRYQNKKISVSYVVKNN